MPLRNAESVLPMAFHNLMNLTYDHSLIDIAFLVSDCSPDDRTLETVFEYSVALQNGTLLNKLQLGERQRHANVIKGSSDLYQLYMDPDYMNNIKKSYNPETFHENYHKPFRSISIFRKDFGQVIGQGFSDRHAVKVQGIRRKLMGRARNWLTSNALKSYHSWVYWRDVDIETCPGSVIQDLMKHDYDVMVPNVWRPLPTFLGNEQPYDLNSWVESEAAVELAKSLDEEDVIVEGYAEYPTWRVHLAYIRDPNGDPNEIIDIDGVGGVSILARARIFRQGVHFPAFTFLNHAETEAFGKMAKSMGFRVGGLPHYTIWHIYEPSEDDLREIAKMERKKRRQKGK
ncbi:DEHA2F03014p [Debaryomyces hansenii CBS767]|uniref:DEHA2F03014p n=1 Tax=Debaryomyces hansenii (strain ATCC 36239 / CBS 767 / BCRC 21394 / JCM 1990 / NBRC 0083 / IGC 2968) TaxID=284592 RepID=B5RU84_DEBHA|nr:DEHA2F03014p [Debaryomyces hansenii CBS767]CAR66261.1 DEHA2F03014p [Debaryomyces hansenii CBS767]|eukprot:XP_002770730.1 DEHA2F03014p [Debaryomyces hansenii CBS767]